MRYLESLLLVVKGFIIGIGKVIPGVSGAMLAISLGLYEKSLEAITHFFRNVPEYFHFLCSIGIGVALAIILGSKMIAFFLTHFYLPTMLLFIGLITGGTPDLIKKVKSFPRHKSHFFILILSFSVVIALAFVHISPSYLVNDNMKVVVYLAMGFIDAATMVIPGISGTAIFMLLGLYEISLGLFSSLDSIGHIIAQLDLLIPFGIGLVIGVFLISFLMTYILKYHASKTYYGILGFQFAAILMILLETLEYNYSIFEIMASLLLFLIGFVIAKYFDRVE